MNGPHPSSAPSTQAPSTEAILLVVLAVVSFGLKYAAAMYVANALGVDDYELYAVPVASVTLASTLVELGLGKQGIRLMPQYMAEGDFELAAGYWRFSSRVVLGLSVGVGVIIAVANAWFPALASLASDEALYLLPIVALTGMGAEIVLAMGAAVTATVVVRLLIPGALLGLLALTRVSEADGALLAYGGSWACAGLVLLVTFVIVTPRPVLTGPSRFETRAWLRGGLGFLALALAISALVDGTVALTEFAGVAAADISIYAVCVETGAFVLVLVKSLDKFYLQRISGLVTRGEIREIHRIRRRRMTLMSIICALFCLAIVLGGRELLASFGPGFVRGYIPLCGVAFATSAWTLASLSQWLIAFIDGPAHAFRITMGGVFAAYTAILILGPSQGLLGVALAYAVLVTLMSVVLEIRVRATLSRLDADPEGGAATS